MRIITSRPIIDESMSNCCGMSNASGDAVGTQVKSHLGEQKSERQKGRKSSTADILSSRTDKKAKARTTRGIERDVRQADRQARIDARHKRRSDRKANKNATKLKLIKTTRGENFVFPLSRIRLGKKKYADGKTVDVPKADIGVAIDPTTGVKTEVDKAEVASALGKSKEAVTQTDINQAVAPITLANSGEIASPDSSKIGIIVPENIVEVLEDGSPYLMSQTQDVSTPTEDVKDKERGMTKTTKIVLISAVVVAVGIIVYIAYNARKK